MRAAGFLRLSLAVEHANDHIRNQIIGKHTTKEKIFEVVRAAKENNFFVRIFIVVGLPEETENTLLEVKQLINALPVDSVSVFVAKPLPGTKLFEQCQKDDLFVVKTDISEYWSGLTSASKYTAVATFNDNMSKAKELGKNAFFIKPYNLSLEKLSEIYDELLEQIAEKSKAWNQHVEKMINII
jgi:radical SAM superfamily enzyme YgiQ (UPF0313 family)